MLDVLFLHDYLQVFTCAHCVSVCICVWLWRPEVGNKSFLTYICGMTSRWNLEVVNLTSLIPSSSRSSCLLLWTRITDRSLHSPRIFLGSGNPNSRSQSFIAMRAEPSSLHLCGWTYVAEWPIVLSVFARGPEFTFKAPCWTAHSPL